MFEDGSDILREKMTGDIIADIKRKHLILLEAVGEIARLAGNQSSEFSETVFSICKKTLADLEGEDTGHKAPPLVGQMPAPLAKGEQITVRFGSLGMRKAEVVAGWKKGKAGWYCLAKKYNAKAREWTGVVKVYAAEIMTDGQ